MAPPKKMIRSCTTRQAKRAYAKVDHSKSTGLTARGYELAVRQYKILDTEERVRVNKIKRDKKTAKEKADPRQTRLSELFGVGRGEGAVEDGEGEGDSLGGDEDDDLMDEGANVAAQAGDQTAELASEGSVEHHDPMDIVQVLDLTDEAGHVSIQASVKAIRSNSEGSVGQHGVKNTVQRIDPADDAPRDESGAYNPNVCVDDIDKSHHEVDYPDPMDETCYVSTIDEEAEALASQPFDDSEWPPSSYSSAVDISSTDWNTPGGVETDNAPFYDPKSQAVYEDPELPTVEDLLFQPSPKRQKVSHRTSNHIVPAFQSPTSPVIYETPEFQPVQGVLHEPSSNRGAFSLPKETVDFSQADFELAKDESAETGTPSAPADGVEHDMSDDLQDTPHEEGDHGNYGAGGSGASLILGVEDGTLGDAERALRTDTGRGGRCGG
ncbi:hypothetical protein MMC18_002445 [Xylographa bjoerkii]|nr:hypothetical protein [Xylographa bjoerkii]